MVLKGGSLYPHQLEALNWFRKCWYKSKNVILADEMGLGKIVSACAVILSLYFEFKVTLPSLVLVPLSTMPNWLAEFALWALDLNVVECQVCAKARALHCQYERLASNQGKLIGTFHLGLKHMREWMVLFLWLIVVCFNQDKS